MSPRGHKITFPGGVGGAGTITGAANVGAGAGQSFRNITGGNTLNFKTIKAGASIGVTNNADDITIDNSKPENTSVVNVGGGAGLVYRDKTVDQINLKTILAGSGIGVANNANDITISNTSLAPVTYSHTMYFAPDLFAPPRFSVSGDPEPASFLWKYFNTSGQGWKVLFFKKPVGNYVDASLFFLLPHFVDSLNTFFVDFMWFSDNADVVNPVNWQIGAKCFVPGNDPDSVIIHNGSPSQLGAGVGLLVRNNFSFSFQSAPLISGGCWAGFSIRRDFDNHAGGAFLLGMNITFLCAI